jgi:hypothetical protein
MMIFGGMMLGRFKGMQADVQPASDEDGWGRDHPKADAFVNGRLNCGPGG